MITMAWIKMLERPTEPAVIIPYSLKMRKYLKDLGSEETLKIKYKFPWIYLDDNDMKKEVQIFQKMLTKNPLLLHQIAERIYGVCNDYLNTMKSINKSDLKNMNRTQLLSIYKKYLKSIDNAFFAVCAVYPPERILTRRIKGILKTLYKDEKTQEEKYLILTTSPKEVSSCKEQEDLLKLAVEFNKKKRWSKKLKKKLSHHYKKYSWLGAVSIGWTYQKEPFSIEDIKKKIESISNPSKKLQKLRDQKRKIRKEYIELTKKSEITTELVNYAELLQEYIYLKTYRGEVITQGIVLTKPLLEEIAKRFNIQFKDVLYLTPEEIISLLSLENRKKGYKVDIVNNNVVLKPYKAKLEKITKQLELNGQPASIGKAEGRVRLVKTSKDIEKVVEGDVIITLMTTPDMTVALHKASAIVTDEGGILCHAAIVSRELGIPCIIGTRNATKTFKDGDLVKVDAEKGIIKKVTK